jgi:hypothetical protein
MSAQVWAVEREDDAAIWRDRKCHAPNAIAAATDRS